MSISDKVIVASRVVEATQGKGLVPTGALGMWQLFSGLTHARQWAMLAALDREELGYDPATGVVNTQLTTGTYTLAGSLIITLDVLDTAVRLYGRRARTYTNLPSDTAFAAKRKVASQKGDTK